MVLLFEWTAMDRMSSCGVPLSGEDSGLEAVASPLAGYLGKVSRAHVFLLQCHLRKAESKTKRTVIVQNQNKRKEISQTEIFGKRRKFWLDMMAQYVDTNLDAFLLYCYT